jgi:hypothetical protein
VPLNCDVPLSRDVPLNRTWTRCGGLVAALALVALPAQGEAPERLNIRSDSACPSSKEVASQLAPLMPETELAAAGALSELASDTVTIRETPGGLRVEASGEDREFRALPGDCGERARIIAVFVHLKYSPLLVAESVPPSSSDTPPARASTVASADASADATKLAPTVAPKLAVVERSVAPTVARDGASPNHWGMSLGLAAMTNLDARALGRSLDYGVSARGWVGDDWALAFGLSVLLPSKHDLLSGVATEGAVLTVWRTPADLALRYQRRWANASFYGELGLEAALLRVSRLTAAGQVYRLEWGPRVGLGIGRVLGDAITLGASLFATFVPTPYEFRLEPRDSLGTSPAAWGGASLGVWF